MEVYFPSADRLSYLRPDSVESICGRSFTYVQDWTQLQILQILRFFVWLRFLANFTIFRQLIAKFAIFYAAL